MNKDAPSAKTKTDKSGGQTNNSLIAEGIGEWAEASPQPFGELSALGREVAVSHATASADLRLRTVQRQQVVRQMGRLQGNRQLQRVVAPPVPTILHLKPAHASVPVIHSQPPQHAEQAAVQREEGWLSSAWSATKNVASSVVGAIAHPKEAALKLISGFAKDIPGYHLLGLILGKDPISDQVVDRTPTTIFQAVLGLVPGGNKLFDSLNESGAVDKAFAWLEAQWEQLGLSWEAIKGLFKQAWNVLDFGEVLSNPSGTWDKLKGIFIGPINRIKTFVFNIGQKIMEFVFEGVMEKMGGGAVVALLKRAGGAFMSIIKDPIGFLGNLIGGIRQGFQNFAANIGTHIKKGLMSWLFGELAATGLELPQAFDMKGILSLVMQMLGMTWQNLRMQATKVLGAGVVGKLESAFEIFQIIREQGMGGLWEYVKDQLGTLKETVLGGIKEMVITQVIQSGVKWLMSTLAGPAGAIVKAIESIYNVVTWVMNNAQRIGSLVSAVGNAIESIAGGAVGVAANFIEKALADAIPTVIGFLSSLIGVGDFGGKIRRLVERVQEPVNEAVGWVIGKAKAFGAKLLGKVKGVFGGQKEQSPEVAAGLAALHAEEAQLAENGGISRGDAEKIVVDTKKAHPIFRTMEVIDGGDRWNYGFSLVQRNSEKGVVPKQTNSKDERTVDEIIREDFNQMNPAQYLHKRWPRPSSSKLPLINESDDSENESRPKDRIHLVAFDAMRERLKQFVLRRSLEDASAVIETLLNKIVNLEYAKLADKGRKPPEIKVASDIEGILEAGKAYLLYLFTRPGNLDRGDRATNRQLGALFPSRKRRVNEAMETGNRSGFELALKELVAVWIDKNETGQVQPTALAKNKVVMYVRMKRKEFREKHPDK